MELLSVMVTGANRGIGLEFVRQLVQLCPPPKYIFATYRDENSIQELIKIRDDARKTKVCLIKMDITNDDDIINASKIVEHEVKEDGLTLLINNSGALQLGAFPEIKKEHMNSIFAVNTVGPVLLTQMLYPLLKRSAARKDGPGMSFSRAAVLNITSLAGSIENTGILFPADVIVPSYKISKAALNMAMRICSVESKKDNILVIMMCPGWVKTDMGTEQAEIEPEESISTMLSTIAKLDEMHHGTYMNRCGVPYPF